MLRGHMKKIMVTVPCLSIFLENIMVTVLCLSTFYKEQFHRYVPALIQFSSEDAFQRQKYNCEIAIFNGI